MHHTRYWRHGDPLKTKVNMKPITWDYMLSCSVVNKKTGCIEWQKGKSSGYGAALFNNKTDRTHRISYVLNVGDIPDGLFVLHKCDNKICINPEHLFLGTMQDNIKDMVDKGRNIKGESMPLAKLKEEEIRIIRAMDKPHKVIAKLFGVDRSNISRIKSREAWRHVT
jgi:hypothetical protein